MQRKNEAIRGFRLLRAPDRRRQIAPGLKKFVRPAIKISSTTLGRHGTVSRKRLAHRHPRQELAAPSLNDLQLELERNKAGGRPTTRLLDTQEIPTFTTGGLKDKLLKPEQTPAIDFPKLF